MTSDIHEYSNSDLKTNMKAMLNDLCEATVKGHRRIKLYSILNKLFPNRLKIEGRQWKDEVVDVTINFVLPFGNSLDPNTDYLVIGAHYDAVPGVPGANDNGAAVIQLIEAAIQLQDSGKEPDVMFVFFDHEEVFGGKVMGSKVFCEQHEANLPIQAVVYDVTGIGDTFFVSGFDYTDILWDYPTRRTPPSDNFNLKKAGVDTALVCALPEDQFYDRYPTTWEALHTKDDNMDLIDEDTLHAGAELAGLIIDRWLEQQSFDITSDDETEITATN